MQIYAKRVNVLTTKTNERRPACD